MGGPDDDDDLDDYDHETCPHCCGDGWVEYDECPEEWGEDCPAEVNHLVRCPECGGTGEA